MRNLCLPAILLLLLITAACHTGTISKHALKLTDLEKDFKYHNLNRFDIDTFDWESRVGKYVGLDSAYIPLVRQQEEQTFYLDKQYLFSWQNRDTNFIEFTILSQNESDYCDNVTYLIFDKKGKAIDFFPVYANCGDGGWLYSCNGKFVDKNIFDGLSIETNEVPADSTDEQTAQEGDSTAIRYSIGKDGRVTETLLYKRHFTIIDTVQPVRE